MKKTLNLLAVTTFVATLSGCACCPALNCGLCPCCPWNRPAPACPPPTYAAPCAPACPPAYAPAATYAPVAACAPACPPAQPCVQWDPCRNAIVPRSNAMPAAPIFAQAPAMAAPCSPCAQMGPQMQMMTQPMYYAEPDCGCGFAEASCGIPSNVGYSGMPIEMEMGGSGCTTCGTGAGPAEMISPMPGE